MSASVPLCLSAGNPNSKLDTCTWGRTLGSDASKRGTGSGVCEGVSRPPCPSWRRWPCPAAPHAQQSRGFYSEAPPLTCSSPRGRRTFQERIPAESPPEVSKAPGVLSAPTRAHSKAIPPAPRLRARAGLEDAGSSAPPRVCQDQADGCGPRWALICASARKMQVGRGARGQSWRWAAFPSPFNARVDST